MTNATSSSSKKPKTGGFDNASRTNASRRKREASPRSEAKPKGQKPNRTERRFVSERSLLATISVAGTVVAGLALGGGAYGYLMVAPAVTVALWLMLGGLLLLAAVIVWGDVEGMTLRVGDGGVARERGGKVILRLAWCDMREVGLRNSEVYIEASSGRLSFAIAANPIAAAWIASEASKRIPTRWKPGNAQAGTEAEADAHTDAGTDASAAVAKTSGVDVNALPKVSDGDGELVSLEPTQIAGRPCRASGRPIIFEEDACLCPRCGEVYAKDTMPERCLTCDAPLRS